VRGGEKKFIPFLCYNDWGKVRGGPVKGSSRLQLSKRSRGKVKWRGEGGNFLFKGEATSVRIALKKRERCQILCKGEEVFRRRKGRCSHGHVWKGVDC